MSGVGAPSVGDQVRAHAAVGEVHQMKPRCARRKGEVGDADNIPVDDAVAMLLQSIERAAQQIGVYLAVDTFCASPSEPGTGGPRDKACQGKIDKKTARNDQDDGLQGN